MSVDDLVSFALHHYASVGLAGLGIGVGLNLAFQCGPDLIEAVRHPKLN